MSKPTLALTSEGEKALAWRRLITNQASEAGPTSQIPAGFPNQGVATLGNAPLADLAPAPPTSRSDAEWISIVTSVAGQRAAALISIASDATKTTDEKMRLIYAMNGQVLGWNSSRWASVLRVSDAAVRKTHWWKSERPQLRG